MKRTYSLVAALAVGSAFCLGFAHEDDAKVLDRRPAYAGRGMRSARPGIGNPPAGTSGPSHLMFPTNGVRLMSWLSLHDLGGYSNGNSLWGYTSPSGREYACFGSSHGVSFVEVTDPGNAQIVGFIDGPRSLWRDVRIYQSYAYAVSEGGSGVQVIDLSQIDNGVVTLANTILTGGEGATHTVFINTASGYLYRSGGGSNGLRIYSLSNPVNPQLVATWSTRYVHEVTVVSYTSGPYAGKEIAFACSGYNGGWSQPGVDIIDVTNKSNLSVLKHFFYSGAAYSHQCWPSADLRYLYLNDELDENGSITTLTKVFDIQSLTNPIEKPSFTNASTAVGHNLYVNGNRIYEANYRSGLRIFDNTNPLAPVEVASFDTWPDDDEAHFNGLWNVYPFFASGTVIGSDIEKGLFVWWIGPPRVDITLPNGAPTTLDSLGGTIDVDLTELNPGDLLAGSAELHYDAGQGWVSTPLVALGGDAYQAQFPTLACSTPVAWYVTASSTNGMTWTEPQGAPGYTHTTIAALARTTLVADDFSADAGWTTGIGGDTEYFSRWMRGIPTASQAQPGHDHSEIGDTCWFTGGGSIFTSDNSHDVDGKTTLLSPAFALASAQDPWVSYWRWFSSSDGANPGLDRMRVDASNDDGQTWIELELVGPTGPQTEGGWYLHQVRLRDFVAPTDQVRLRFVVNDTLAESLVEAALDDFSIFELDCAAAPTTYCTAKLNSQGCAAQIAVSGTPSASSPTPFDISATNVLNQKSGLLFYGYTPASLPFQGGFKCVDSPTRRTPIQLSGGNPSPDDCSGTFSFDFNQRIQSGLDPNLFPGASAYAQYWYRDGADPLGFGTALTDAVEFAIEL